MEREIKFEIALKDKSSGETIKMVINIFDLQIGVAFYQIDSEKWELIYKRQFTGLKDKNGKEIYEGDIVSSLRDNKIIVYWNEETAAFEGKNTANHKVLIPVIDNINGIVLGNIQENGDLL